MSVTSLTEIYNSQYIFRTQVGLFFLILQAVHLIQDIHLEMSIVLMVTKDTIMASVCLALFRRGVVQVLLAFLHVVAAIGVLQVDAYTF